MSIIYDEGVATGSRGGPFNYMAVNANKGFLTHSYNLLTLQWISKHTDDWREKRQCEAEIKIAERKVAYHMKHPNFESAEVDKDLAKMKRDFSG